MDLETAEKPDLASRISWDEWLRQWHQAGDMRTCLSLLHTGFEAEAGTDGRISHRIRFYLKVANGWLIESGERDSQQKRLGRKAFYVLGDRLFQPEGIHGGYEKLFVLPSNVTYALSEFFCPRGSYEGAGLTNLSEHEPSDANKMARDFIVGLCGYIIVGNPMVGSGFNQSTLRLLEGQRPWALRTLHALGDRLLLRVVISGEWWEKLDECCLNGLRGLALQTQVGSPQDGWRNAETVAEALAKNSSAAILLTLHAKLKEIQVMQ